MPNNKNFFTDKQAEYNNPETERGWHWPVNAIKLHYFMGGRSLCGSWQITPTVLEDSDHNNADNCDKCKHIRNRLDEAQKL